MGNAAYPRCTMYKCRLFLQVFVFSSDKIYKENYSNMYTLMVTNAKGGLAKVVLKAPQRLQPAAYLLMHCLLCWAAVLIAVGHFYKLLP